MKTTMKTTMKRPDDIVVGDQIRISRPDWHTVTSVRPSPGGMIEIVIDARNNEGESAPATIRFHRLDDVTVKRPDADRWDRAAKAFDDITGASYYGPRFRSVLNANPAALAAAETLAKFLAESGLFD